jgi:hypothetical protein
LGRGGGDRTDRAGARHRLGDARNRGATRHELERTEAATKAMYDEQNREDIARDNR